MSWIQTSNNTYQEVKNLTNNTIAPYSIVYSSGYDTGDNVSLISVIDDIDVQLPLGILTNIPIIQNEISHVLVKGDIPYNTSLYEENTKVFCNSSGQISFEPTPLMIGYVSVSAESGIIHIDVNYVFTSQINNVYSYESESNEAITNLDIGYFNYIQIKGYISLSGISSGFVGRIVAIHNDPTSSSIRLLNNSNTSDLGNRLSLPEDEIELQNDGIVKFIYDGSFWKLIGGNYNQNQNSSIISVYQDGTSFSLGNPVYIDSNGVIQKAIVNTQSNYPARGLIYSKSETLTRIILSGKIKLTINEWDLITGDEGGLVVGATYYTSSSDVGKITTNKPYIGNPVMIALDSTTALVQVGIIASQPIPSMLETWLFR